MPKTIFVVATKCRALVIRSEYTEPTTSYSPVEPVQRRGWHRGRGNLTHAGGGPGTQSTRSINVNSGSDPYLVLDPSVTVAQMGQQGAN